MVEEGQENIKQLITLHGLIKSKPLFLHCRLLTITPAKFQDSFWCCWNPGLTGIVDFPFLQVLPSFGDILCCICFSHCPITEPVLYSILSPLLLDLTLGTTAPPAILVGSHNLKSHVDIPQANPQLTVDANHLSLHLLSWPASPMPLCKEKEPNDGFARSLTLAIFQESSCFPSAHPFDEHSHHLYHRWSQSQALWRYTSHLHLCASRRSPCLGRKTLANTGIVPLLIATASISSEKLFSVEEWYVTEVLQFLMSQKSKSRFVQSADTHPSQLTFTTTQQVLRKETPSHSIQDGNDSPIPMTAPISHLPLLPSTKGSHM